VSQVALFDLVGDAHLVLLGEASHGTGDLYAARGHMIVGPRGPDVDQPKRLRHGLDPQALDRLELPFGAGGQVVELGRIEASMHLGLPAQDPPARSLALDAEQQRLELDDGAEGERCQGALPRRD